MKKFHTHYDNLKVARSASQEVIRGAYKTLLHKYHPDRNSNDPDAARIMVIINTAYEVLSDLEKRTQHDAWIAKKEAELSQQNKTRQNFYAIQMPLLATAPITFKPIISHVSRNWIIYGVIVALIWGTYSVRKPIHP